MKSKTLGALPQIPHKGILSLTRYSRNISCFCKERDLQNISFSILSVLYPKTYAMHLQIKGRN